MAFREKSAWVMLALMLATGLWYLNMLVASVRASGWDAPPIGIVVPYVLVVIVGSIVVQVALAILTPREADAPADERERPMLDRAGHLSGLVLGGGAITALVHFLAHGQGNLLFHMVMGSLILAQIAEYAAQIILYRRG